jgi:hypothetical protein
LLKDAASSIIRELRARPWCTLGNADVECTEFESDSDFFQARPRLGALCWRKQRRYRILVNCRAAELGLSHDAMRGILAHELDHLLFYHERTRLVCLAWSLLTLLFHNHCIRFERRADLRTVYRGFAQGLAAYRLWLYARVNQRVMLSKRRVYLTPEEITEVDALRLARPELEAFWLQHVPRSLEQIRRATTK